MLLNFTDDMEIVSNGDITYAFYKKVVMSNEKEKFKGIFDTFSLHSVILYTKRNPLFTKEMEEYLSEE
jgi:hypothetical protein